MKPLQNNISLLTNISKLLHAICHVDKTTLTIQFLCLAMPKTIFKIFVVFKLF